MLTHCPLSSLARGFDINYETPRSEKLSLFDLGERKYDHLIFLPTKVKGTAQHASSPLAVSFVLTAVECLQLSAPT